VELERVYGEEYADFVDLMGKVRDRLLAEGSSQVEERAARFERLAGSDLPRLLQAQDTAAIDALLREVLGEGYSLAALEGQQGEEPADDPDE
jgi:hypothetical protein